MSRSQSFVRIKLNVCICHEAPYSPATADRHSLYRISQAGRIEPALDRWQLVDGDRD